MGISRRGRRIGSKRHGSVRQPAIVAQPASGQALDRLPINRQNSGVHFWETLHVDNAIAARTFG